MKTITTVLSFALFAVLIAGCTQGSGEKEKTYDIKGKVVSLDSEKKNVRLDHEAIPGYMGAMVMDFTVQAAKMLAGLKAGDAVHGKLKVKDGNRTITELQKH